MMREIAEVLEENGEGAEAASCTSKQTQCSRQSLTPSPFLLEKPPQSPHHPHIGGVERRNLIDVAGHTFEQIERTTIIGELIVRI